MTIKDTNSPFLVLLDTIYSSCLESRLTYIAQSRRDYDFTGRPSQMYSIRDCKQPNLSSDTEDERQRTGQAAGRTRQMWSETDKHQEEGQVTCCRNVTDG